MDSCRYFLGVRSTYMLVPQLLSKTLNILQLWHIFFKLVFQFFFYYYFNEFFRRNKLINYFSYPKQWKIFKKYSILVMKKKSFYRSISAECLASFLYVFIVCGAAAGAGVGASVSSVLLASALASGFAITTLTQCFSQISGNNWYFIELVVFNKVNIFS